MRGLQMTTKIILFILCMICTVPQVTHAIEKYTPPVTCHIDFDSTDYLALDYAATYNEPAFEQRKLSLVPGKFGSALHNENTFSREDLEQTSMSTWDLDVLLEVLVHHRFKYYEKYNAGHMEPYFWGTGRLKGDSGCVAFWARGKRTYPGNLFIQGSSSFGRHEKDLIGIDLREDNTIEAYVRDARYVYHSIVSPPVWREDTFNHVALTWDRAMGLTLYINGAKVASNWGTDSWWATQMPGLFHMPMCGFMYDELWTFDRALSAREIKRLMDENLPPENTDRPGSYDKRAAQRLKDAFCGGSSMSLPTVRQFMGSAVPTCREILPVWAGDGCVKAPFIMDGKYELAWPQDYTSFTNILGDSDFHPEKVDIQLPESATVNYVTLDGNLTNASLMAGSGPDSEYDTLFSVPEGDGQFYGQSIDPVKETKLRIPFVTGYGSPPGYEEGLHLPLTGDIRIHEVGLYELGTSTQLNTAEGRRLYIGRDAVAPDDPRTGYAFRAMTDLRSSRLLSLIPDVPGGERWVKPGPYTRLNVMSDQWTARETMRSIDITLHMRAVKDNDIIILRLHDPGVPARIWNTLVFRMTDYPRSGGVFRMILDCTDIKMDASDRLWLDIAVSGDAEILTGGAHGSHIIVETSPLADSDGRYVEKALLPAHSDFTKIYHWYYPWTRNGVVPDPEAPVTFGGYYDIVTYPLITARTEPDNFVVQTILELAHVRNPFIGEPGFTNNGADTVSRDSSPELWPTVISTPADGSPEWAFYMNYYLTRYRDILYWWAEMQHEDGQVGGGWNDDVLFASRLPGLFLYTGDIKARRLFNRVFEGLEHTRMFHDGYCNIVPMDYIHVEDLVRNRYEGLLFELGDPHKMNISMRTAWRYGKPERTPDNYIDGASFKYDYDLIRWYWGKTPDYQAYHTTRDQVTETVRKFAPAMDAVMRYRYTEAGMFTDGAYMPGCYQMKQIQIGGGWGPFIENLTLAVSWEQGGEPEIPKWVETATDTSFIAHMYSYDTVEQDVTARMYRLAKGTYRITLDYEGDDAEYGSILDTVRPLQRFSTVTVPVRPGRELVLRISCIERLPESETRPDLAISSAVLQEGKVCAEIENFGDAAAQNVAVHLVDVTGRTLCEQTVNLSSSVDFEPGKAVITFASGTSMSSGMRVIVDPWNNIEEIFEENNTIAVLSAD